MKYTIDNHIHEYEITIRRPNGEECKHCGLLKSTIEASHPKETEWEARERVGEVPFDKPVEELIYNPENPTVPTWKVKPVENNSWEEKFKTSAMRADAVRGEIDVVPLSVAIWLTKMLLSKEKQKLDSIVAEIEGGKKEVFRYPSGEKTELGEMNDEFNIGLDRALEIIKKHHF